MSVLAEDTDYSYLEDMTVKELRELDAAIHQILGKGDNEAAQEVLLEDETEAEPVLMKEEDFFADILASYSARQVISNRYSNSETSMMTDEELQEWHKELIDAEWPYMSKYENAVFDDLNIQYLCDHYLGGLKKQKRSYEYYFSNGDVDNASYQWSSGYENRCYVIVELADYYEIEFPADAVDVMRAEVEALDSLDEAETRNSQVPTETVKEVQTLLHEIGFRCWNIDGVAGKRTVKAIKRFQEMYGYEIDGMIDDELIDQLKQIKAEKGLETEEDTETGTEE